MYILSFIRGRNLNGNELLI
jgi:isocitrate dehydrogenase